MRLVDCALLSVEENAAVSHTRYSDTGFLLYVASGAKGVSRNLSTFLDLLSPEARILELGCGGGRDAAAMIAAGFDVDPRTVRLRLPEKPKSASAGVSA